ncbi:MAG: 7-cyano-7-deazaguanine synthase QueC [Rhodospirillaceae bacterium]|nr:MAG: 7-cyano-7-deazaguanine synthase QueC [Rhodospirillaceae bacterium]
MKTKPRAVVLLSGGIDSATTLALAIADGFDVYALSLRYGQRHGLEIAAAKKIAARLGATAHKIQEIDLRLFGGSALTDDIAVPKDRDMKKMAAEIPVTYVPARNTIFLSFALAWAEVLGARAIFIGVNALDYSGYPDCRPEFIAAFERMAALATKAGVEGGAVSIRTPLIDCTKADIVTQGMALGIDYGLTLSCYDPAPDNQGGVGIACGHCDSCHLRRKGFGDAGIDDPTRYADPVTAG